MTRTTRYASLIGAPRFWGGVAVVGTLSLAATAGSAGSVLRPLGVMLGALCVLLAVGRNPSPARPWAVGPWAAAWVAVIAAPVAFQLANFTRQPRETYPTVSSLINLAFENHAARATGFALWLALGWYLLRR